MELARQAKGCFAFHFFRGMDMRTLVAYFIVPWIYMIPVAILNVTNKCKITLKPDNSALHAIEMVSCGSGDPGSEKNINKTRRLVKLLIPIAVYIILLLGLNVYKSFRWRGQGPWQTLTTFFGFMFLASCWYSLVRFKIVLQYPNYFL